MKTMAMTYIFLMLVLPLAPARAQEVFVGTVSWTGVPLSRTNVSVTRTIPALSGETNPFNLTITGDLVFTSAATLFTETLQYWQICEVSLPNNCLMQCPSVTPPLVGFYGCLVDPMIASAPANFVAGAGAIQQGATIVGNLSATGGSLQISGSAQTGTTFTADVTVR